MKLIKYILIVLLTGFLFAGCQPDDFKPVGETRNVMKAIPGTYTLVKVTQTDNDAVKKGFPYKTMDITKFYAGFKITLNTDGNGTPTSFTTTVGTGGNGIIGLANGNWSVNDPVKPATVTFGTGATAESLKMGAYTALDANKLKFQRVRMSGANAMVTYEYEFTKN